MRCDISRERLGLLSLIRAQVRRYDGHNISATCARLSIYIPDILTHTEQNSSSFENGTAKNIVSYVQNEKLQ